MIRGVAAMVCGCAWLCAGTAAAQDKYSFDSYFKAVTVTALSVSADGQWLAFNGKSIRPDAGASTSTLTLMRIDAPRSGVELERQGTAAAFAWTANGSRLAYGSRDASGAARVVLYDVRTGQRKNISSPVFPSSIAWSPDDRQLLVVGPLPPDPDAVEENAAPLLDGVLVDAMTVNTVDVRRPAAQINVRAPQPVSAAYRIDVARGTAVSVSAGESLDIREAVWSPDGHSLALIVAERRPDLHNYWAAGSHLLQYRIAGGELVTLRRGQQSDTSLDDIVEYFSPVWSPDGRTLAVNKHQWAQRWSMSPQLELVSLADPGAARPLDFGDTDLPYLKVSWSPAGIFLGTVQRGRRSVFRLSPKDAVLRDCFEDRQRGYSQWSLTADGAHAVYVAESFFEPQSIYRAPLVRGCIDPRRAVRIAAPNDGVNVGAHTFSAESWKSPDGVLAHGWLLKPATHAKQHPLLVVVHGGPSSVIRNEYLPLMSAWPYPLHAFLDQGYAVFIPNYRMSPSFGNGYRTFPPAKFEATAVADIVSGVEWVRARHSIAGLGMMGHSWGHALSAMAGPQIDGVRALSLGDGICDLYLTYGVNSAIGAREINEYISAGVSGFDDPLGYIQRSPITFLRRYTSPILIENGDTPNIGDVLGAQPFVMGLARFGKPHEWVVYPTGHNVQIGILQQRIAERNLDWFNFWIKGEEDAQARKAEQYRRWRGLQQRSRPHSEAQIAR